MVKINNYNHITLWNKIKDKKAFKNSDYEIFAQYSLLKIKRKIYILSKNACTKISIPLLSKEFCILTFFSYHACLAEK